MAKLQEVLQMSWQFAACVHKEFFFPAFIGNRYDADLRIRFADHVHNLARAHRIGSRYHHPSSAFNAREFKRLLLRGVAQNKVVAQKILHRTIDILLNHRHVDFLRQEIVAKFTAHNARADDDHAVALGGLCLFDIIFILLFFGLLFFEVELIDGLNQGKKQRI